MPAPCSAVSEPESIQGIPLDVPTQALHDITIDHHAMTAARNAATASRECK